VPATWANVKRNFGFFYLIMSLGGLTLNDVVYFSVFLALSCIN